MTSLSRRRLLLAGAGVAAGSIAGCAGITSRTPGPRVVVIGGGYGGATCARYLRMWSDNRIDVTLTDTTLLANLDTTGSSVTDLARRAGVTRQSASQQVAALVKAGYLTAEASATDRRASLVIQTDKGRKLLATALEVVAALEAQYATALGPRRHAQLHHALDALLEHGDPDGGLPTP